ncbi:hypothetical protein M404DRAFT_292218 [Pisolithus tinctorius Marx 270]|uniref:Uncharacterized protein n=1 Tax=Pisolithus tinctorius Marx 270 TaxID=870435 RepID=A0A0C3NL97_PISTI|nr:hypothetical protein M404DRAFT_292218 [Pisolithus tinctorius Marx 270]
MHMTVPFAVDIPYRQKVVGSLAATANDEAAPQIMFPRSESKGVRLCECIILLGRHVRSGATPSPVAKKDHHILPHVGASATHSPSSAQTVWNVVRVIDRHGLPPKSNRILGFLCIPESTCSCIILFVYTQVHCEGIESACCRCCCGSRWAWLCTL